MAHPRKRPRLALESISKHFIAREIRSLESYCASKSLIDSEINLAHAALANEVDDEISVLN
jgi:hypothetical protein